MHVSWIKRGAWKTIAAGGLLLALTAPSAFGQNDGWVPVRPNSCLPLPAPLPPGTPLAQPPAPPPPSPPTPQPESLPALAPESGLAFGGQTVAVAPGYIDDAVVRSQFRLRFEAAYNDNRPDRAEFFYPKCGCFVGGRGPALAETRVDYQDLCGYLEYAASERLSGFLEVPYRMLNAEVNKDTNGFSDINAGFKAALWNNPDQILTFQFRTYVPTGSGARGLGTQHVSLEPSLLGYLRLTDRWALYGELRDWIPIGGTEFAGNVIRYGVGASYTAYRNGRLWVAPITELVGWTVLGGREFDAVQNEVLNADGDTIVNAKFGARVGWGHNSDFYVGYGRALTGQVWYKDIFRVEYRIAF